MSQRKDRAERKAALARAIQGGVLLGHDDQRKIYEGTKVLHRGTPGATTVRNVVTGRVLPCCYLDCDIDGSTTHQVAVPHDSPRFKGEMLVYIFCSPEHRAAWLKGTPYEDRA